MNKLNKKEGVLAQLLSTIDPIEQEKVNNRMLIAAKIGEALKNNNMSQKVFAKKMGRTQSEISSWLSGDRNFTIDTLTEIGKMLSISLFDTDVKQKYCVYVENIVFAATTKQIEIKNNRLWEVANDPIKSSTKCLKVS